MSAHGENGSRNFAPGFVISLLTDKGTLEEQAQTEGLYLLTGVQHSFGLPGGYTSGDSKGFFYRNTFTCAPATLPYRPPRTVPRPVIAGTQTAVVVGPPGEELYVDKYGRVKVQFFWDREGKKNLDSSCWVRVAQSWAGQRWGAHFWPRVGQEVVVAFEEGDPDQPIVVGSVYNAENLPPYALGQHKTRSGVKTRTTPQGTADNFNEIRFEDRKGAEELFVQAERTMNVLVKGDKSHLVGGDYKLEVHGKGGLVTNVTNGSVAVGARKHQLIGAGGNIQLFCDEGFIRLSAAVSGYNAGTWDGDPTKKAILLSPTQIFLNLDDKQIVIDQAGGIFLSCGGGQVNIDAAGNVNISGTSVNINGASAATVPPPTDCGAVGGGWASSYVQGECTIDGKLAPAFNGPPATAKSP